jgi:hypothetical protein
VDVGLSRLNAAPTVMAKTAARNGHRQRGSGSRPSGYRMVGAAKVRKKAGTRRVWPMTVASPPIGSVCPWMG